MLIRQVGQGLNGNVGYASALSVALFLISVAPLIAIAWMNREKKALA
jgi:multiple sugar transport system permease protein